MNAIPGMDGDHPHFVSIPDPEKVEGLRAYREPEVPHPLQVTFLEEAGERAWIEEMRGLLSSERVVDADALLAAELAGLEGNLAQLCKAVSPDDVAVEGWEDLLPILAEWEGPEVTAITLGLTNTPDLVFDLGKTHDPELLIGLYSDEAFPFSRTSNAKLLAECAKETPGWTGAEEDAEFYCTLTGLAELNTALVNCKHRRFLRDGRDGVEGRAPGGYVEYVVASWLMATRFLQAAERAVAEHGLPAGCRLIAGTVDVNSDFVAILGGDQPSGKEASPAVPSSEPSFATLTIKPWVPREDPTAVAPASGSLIRQRLQAEEPAEPESEPETVEEPRRGFFARLFGRRRPKQDG